MLFVLVLWFSLYFYYCFIVQNRFGHVSPTSAKHVLDDLGHSDISIIADDKVLTGSFS